MKGKGRLKQRKSRRYSANLPQGSTRGKDRLVYVQVDGKWQPRTPLTEEEEMMLFQMLSHLTHRRSHVSERLSELLKDFSHPIIEQHPIFGIIAHPSFEFKSNGIFVIGSGTSHLPDGEETA